MKHATQRDRAARARVRWLLCLLIVAGTMLAGWTMEQQRTNVLVPSALTGLAIAAAFWIMMAFVSPIHRARPPVIQMTEFEDTKVNAIPGRRHSNQEITVAADALRRAIKERIEALPALGHKAGHDPLTRLADRASLYALSDWLDESRGLPNVELCLLCVELKGLEPVKTRYGGKAGDHVLTKVAKRLRDASREEDFLFRLGGDEFMLLVPSPVGRGVEVARSVGKRVMSDVQRPLPYLTVSNLAISCSVGSAIWPLDGSKLGDVLRNADAALADTRVPGRGGYKQYSSQDSQPA